MEAIDLSKGEIRIHNEHAFLGLERFSSSWKVEANGLHLAGGNLNKLEVPPLGATGLTLNLDHKQMGVGGDTSWGARTHPEYTLRGRSYRYRFRLHPIGPEDDVDVIARTVPGETP